MNHKIEKVQIEQYGQLASFCCDRFSNINLIIGENGTGKTFLLKALYSAVRFKDLFEQQLRNDMRIWKIQNFIIMNEETAYKRHFITKIMEEQTDEAALAAPLKRDQ